MADVAKAQARKRDMGPAHDVRFLYEPNAQGVMTWTGICTACKTPFSADTGADLEALAAEHEAINTAIAQDGVTTPGCDCDHVGYGKAWHKRSCKWLATQVTDVKPGKA